MSSWHPKLEGNWKRVKNARATKTKEIKSRMIFQDLTPYCKPHMVISSTISSRFGAFCWSAKISISDDQQCIWFNWSLTAKEYFESLMNYEVANCGGGYYLLEKHHPLWWLSDNNYPVRDQHDERRQKALLQLISDGLTILTSVKTTFQSQSYLFCLHTQITCYAPSLTWQSYVSLIY